MTTSSTHFAERDRTSSIAVPAGIATVLTSSVFTYLGAHTWEESASMIALATLAAVLMYGFVVPRAFEKPSAPRTAMTLSVIATVLLLPAFWTGLPLVIGVAGALVGFAGRNAPKGSGLSIAAMLVGVLTVIGYVTIYIVDGFVLGNM